MTENEFIGELVEYAWSHECEGYDGPLKIYTFVLRHIIEGIDPRTTTKDIIFSLESRLKELESE